jgi:hypothetical protein
MCAANPEGGSCVKPEFGPVSPTASTRYGWRGQVMPYASHLAAAMNARIAVDSSAVNFNR